MDGEDMSNMDDDYHKRMKAYATYMAKALAEYELGLFHTSAAWLREAANELDRAADYRDALERVKARCTCDRDTLINDPGMTVPGCPVHDVRVEAKT